MPGQTIKKEKEYYGVNVLLFAVAQMGVETDRGSEVEKGGLPTWPPPDPASYVRDIELMLVPASM